MAGNVTTVVTFGTVPGRGTCLKNRIGMIEQKSAMLDYILNGKKVLESDKNIMVVLLCMEMTFHGWNTHNGFLELTPGRTADRSSFVRAKRC
jgi:hypothetical protein